MIKFANIIILMDQNLSSISNGINFDELKHRKFEFFSFYNFRINIVLHGKRDDAQSALIKSKVDSTSRYRKKWADKRKRLSLD